MRFAQIRSCDIVNGEGVCVSIFVQGCPHHCKNCFNPETWDFAKGKEFSKDMYEIISKAISANGLKRNFSVLGGEPLDENNIYDVVDLISFIRKEHRDIKIYVWTGFTLEELKEKYSNDNVLNDLMNYIDVLIDGRYEEDKRDIKLKLRGSSNQRVLRKGTDF